MAEYRAGLIAEVPAINVPDDLIGSLLDLLKDHDGALEVEAHRLTLTYSFDAADLPGIASGLVAAIPQALAVGRSVLTGSGLLERATVVGISVERVSEVPV